MHAVIRTYSGPAAKKLFDVLEERISFSAGQLTSSRGLGLFAVAGSPAPDRSRRAVGWPRRSARPHI
jgi:hypothetical protein